VSITQNDYILRLLEAFAESLARIARHRARGEAEESLDRVTETAEQVFGTSLPLIDSVDPESAVDLLADPAKVWMYARLTEEEASTLDLLGHDDDAAGCRARALALYLERTRMDPAIDAETTERIQALGSKVDPADLDDRHISLLTAISRQ